VNTRQALSNQLTHRMGRIAFGCVELFGDKPLMNSYEVCSPPGLEDA